MKLMRGREGGKEEEAVVRKWAVGEEWREEGGASSEINLANNSNSDLDISDEKLIKKHPLKICEQFHF